MRKLIYLLAAVASALTILSLPRLRAQTTPTPPIFALACANNSVVPTPTSGAFYLVQCNASGQLLTNGLATTGGTLTGPLILPAGTAAAPALGIGATNTGLFGNANSLSMTIGGVLSGFVQTLTPFTTGLGYQACGPVISGIYNTCLGFNAGKNISSGTYNLAIGAYALVALTTGTTDTGVGYSALGSATFNGSNDVAIGDYAGQLATSGNNETFIGYAAAPGLTSGHDNVAIGYNTGGGLSTGSYNTIIGGSVGGLSSGLADAVIIATGEGTIRADFNNTTANAWNIVGSIGTTSAATGSLGEYTETLQPAAGGGTSTFSGQPTAVINMTNTFTPGNEVQFSTAPATGFSSNTTYYVISAGLTGSTYELSATPGGTAITYTSNTTATTVTTIPLTSNASTTFNIAALNLTAGDWDCEGTVVYVPAATALITLATAGISTTSATLPAAGSSGTAVYSIATGLGGLAPPMTISRKRILISATTPVYLEAEATWTTSTVGAYGDINCRRAR